MEPKAAERAACWIPHKAAGCRFHFKGGGSQEVGKPGSREVGKSGSREVKALAWPGARSFSKRRRRKGGGRAAGPGPSVGTASRRGARKRQWPASPAHTTARCRGHSALPPGTDSPASPRFPALDSPPHGKMPWPLFSSFRSVEGRGTAERAACWIPHKAAGCRFHFRGGGSQEVGKSGSREVGKSGGQSVGMARSAKLQQAQAAEGRRKGSGAKCRSGILPLCA
jgi:hypothetical protein